MHSAAGNLLRVHTRSWAVVKMLQSCGWRQAGGTKLVAAVRQSGWSGQEHVAVLRAVRQLAQLLVVGQVCGWEKAAKQALSMTGGADEQLQTD